MGLRAPKKVIMVRSDSMMVATINFKTKELKLTSFLRDMYVEIPGHGRNKLNCRLCIWRGSAFISDTGSKF